MQLNGILLGSHFFCVSLSRFIVILSTFPILINQKKTKKLAC